MWTVSPRLWRGSRHHGDEVVDNLWTSWGRSADALRAAFSRIRFGDETAHDLGTTRGQPVDDLGTACGDGIGRPQAAALRPPPAHSPWGRKFAVRPAETGVVPSIHSTYYEYYPMSLSKKMNSSNQGLGTTRSERAPGPEHRTLSDTCRRRVP